MLERFSQNKIFKSFVSGVVATMILSEDAKAIKVPDGAPPTEIVKTLEKGTSVDAFESGVVTLSNNPKKENLHVLGSFEGGVRSIDKKELDKRVNEVKRLYKENKQSFKSLVLYHNHPTKTISKLSGKSEEEVKRILQGPSPEDIYTAIYLQRELQKIPELKDLKFISVVVESGGTWIMSSEKQNQISDEDFNILIKTEYPNLRYYLTEHSLKYFKNPAGGNKEIKEAAQAAIENFTSFVSKNLEVNVSYVPHSQIQDVDRIIGEHSAR
jgi:hypothetical protein